MSSDNSCSLVCKPRVKSVLAERYKSQTRGTDIHLRTFACGTVLLCVALSCYMVTWSQFTIVETYTSSSDNCYDGFPYSLPVYGHSPMLGTMYGGLYSSYHQSLLLLAADIELNPGPTEDTQLILNAIAETNAEIGLIKGDVIQIKEDVVNVTSKLQKLNSEINTVKHELSNIQLMQSTFDSRLGDMGEHINHLQYQSDGFNEEFATLSTYDEKHHERCELIEQQLNLMEAERLKCSLRIFGLEETESPDNKLKLVVDEKVLSVADANDNYDESTIIDAKRVGNQGKSKTRLVIVSFKSEHDKLNLFKYRDKLRQIGIRVSNDLSYMQRQQLKHLNRRGLAGYFKGGKLITYQKSNNDNTSRVFMQAKRKGRNEPEHMLTDTYSDQTELPNQSETRNGTSDLTGNDQRK